MCPSTLTLPEITEAIARLPRTGGRLFVAIVGAPGAGKSTFVTQLQQTVPNSAILAMDGFHLDNDTLDKMGRRAFKGAPDTFDTDGLQRCLSTLRKGGAQAVPTFDRSIDRVVSGGGQIAQSDQIILVEGNYLLLEHAGWKDLGAFWDMSILLDVPLETLEDRLVTRWLEHGLPRPEAVARARGNDLVNARSVMTQSRSATCRYRAV